MSDKEKRDWFKSLRRWKIQGENWYEAAKEFVGCPCGAVYIIGDNYGFYGNWLYEHYPHRNWIEPSWRDVLMSANPAVKAGLLPTPVPQDGMAGFSEKLDEITNKKLYDEIETSRNNYNEKGEYLGELALSLRFVVLKAETVLDVVKNDADMLGFRKDAENETVSEDFSSIWTSIYYDYNAITKPDFTDGNGEELYRPMSFCEIQRALKEFVENNCFYGADKPVPRIETDGERRHFTLFYYNNARGEVTFETLSPDAYSAICVLSNSAPKIYTTGQPQFRSEWKQVYPREFSKDDLADKMIPLPSINDGIRLNNGLITDVINGVFHSINQLQTETGIEIWEFKIWKMN